MAWPIFPPQSYFEGMVFSIAALVILLLICIPFLWRTKWSIGLVETFTSFCKFFYASFLKPHTGDQAGQGQQAALESFYKAQVRLPSPRVHTNLTGQS